MALAEIGARLRLQGAAAFNRDAERAADNVDQLGDEAAATDRKLGKMGSAARKAGGALGSIGKAGAFAGIAAAGVGIAGIAAGLYQGFQDAAALQTILAKTNAVIKSTGGVANVSAKGIVNLADELESMSGIDGDAIIEAQNYLLTFTQIRNGVGESNHVFDKATKSLVDYVAATGTDATSAAVMFGKALNDPIKGVGALGKVGVAFTEKQKKSIKTLMAQNKVMAAQDIILKELAVQYGGAAKAAGSGFQGSMDRAKDAMGDLFRDVATPLLPIVTEQLEKFSKKVNDDLAPALVTFAEGFTAGTGEGGKFRDKLKEVWTEFKSVARFAGEAMKKLGDVVQWMVDHKQIVLGFAAAVLTIKTALLAVAAVNAVAAFAPVVLGILGIGTAATGAAAGVGVMTASILGPAGLLAALGLLAAWKAPDFWNDLMDVADTTDGRGTKESPGYGESYVGKDGKPVSLPPLTQGRPLPGRTLPRQPAKPVIYGPGVRPPTNGRPAEFINKPDSKQAAAPVNNIKVYVGTKELKDVVKQEFQDEAARR